MCLVCSAIWGAGSFEADTGAVACGEGRDIRGLGLCVGFGSEGHCEDVRCACGRAMGWAGGRDADVGKLQSELRCQAFSLTSAQLGKVWI